MAKPGRHVSADHLRSAPARGHEAVTLSYTRLEPNTECVDDATLRSITKVVDRMKVGNFDWKSSEKRLSVGQSMTSAFSLRTILIQLRKGDGSCIFLHIWKDSASPTARLYGDGTHEVGANSHWIEPNSNPYLIQASRKGIQEPDESVGIAEAVMKLANIPLGGRLLIRSRTDWRTA
jgi:D-alanyl-D-alanine dipeptidase